MNQSVFFRFLEEAGEMLNKIGIFFWERWFALSQSTQFLVQATRQIKRLRQILPE